MSKMKYGALIIEDEPLAAERLTRVLGEVAPEVEVRKSLGTVQESVAFFQEGDADIDLVFMDIHLADGNAFEIFKHATVSKPIIFTTAFDQYALQAFKSFSVDYLLKPIRPTELRGSIDRFLQHYSKRNSAIDYDRLAQSIREAHPGYQQRFLVHLRDRILPVQVEEICLFFSLSKSTFFITREKQQYDLPKSLEQIYKTLDPDMFFRVNRKCIVHLNAIQEVVLHSKSRLKLHLNVEPPFEIFVPAEKMAAFKAWLSR